MVPDGHDTGWSTCYPSVLGLLEQWFWENTVRWAADGSAVYFSQGPLVFEVAADGSRTGVVADASSLWRRYERLDAETQGPMTSFDIAPQGDRLVFSTCAIEPHGRREQSEQPHYAIAVAEIDGAPDRHLIGSGGFANYPSWSPDGSRIAYLATSRDDKFFVRSVRKTHLEVAEADGSGWRRIWTKQPIVLHPPQWSPDGLRLAVVGTDGARFRHALFIVGADGTDLRQLGRTISGPSWSPDGARLAFVGAADDTGAIWNLLTVGPDGTGVGQVPLARGWEPHYMGGHSILTSLSEYRDGWIPTLAWSPAGDQLLYTCGQRICVVGLDGTPVGRSPLTWPSGKWGESGSVAAWSPDGARIAVAPSVVWDDRHPDVPQPRPLGPAVYTMAPDGTDVRVLAEFDAEGELRPKQPQPFPAIMAAAHCQAGVAVADPSSSRGLLQDCAALLRVQAIWAPRLNWNIERPMSDWVGVASRGSPPRVRELDVSRRGLRGPIPAALGQVTHLSYLDLSHNQFSGSIPVELSQLADLRGVFLAGNQLTGCVPLGLSVIDRDELRLPDCGAATPGNVTGCSTASVVPEPAANPGLVADCETLLAAHTVLDPLGTLNWSADLPLAHWDGVKVAGTPPRVQGLNLSGRGLSGQFPPELSRLTHLRNLGLSRSNLAGPIPPELAALAQLESLYLAGNQLTGCVPPGLPVADREELALPDCEAGA